MQERIMKSEMVLLSVPTDMLLEAGIFEGDPMQMYVEGRRLIIENLDDTDDFVCNRDCAECPFNEIDYDGECESCLCRNDCDDSEVNDDE